MKKKLIFLMLGLLLIGSVMGGTEKWSENTYYNIGDIVKYTGKEYKCLQAHNSLTGWEPPNVPALWEEVTSTPNNGEWTTNTNYNKNKKVTYNSEEYICRQSHTSQSDWTPDLTPALWIKNIKEEKKLELEDYILTKYSKELEGYTINNIDSSTVKYVVYTIEVEKDGVKKNLTWINQE